MAQLITKTPKEPIELAQAIVYVLDQRKAKDIRLLHVGAQTVICDYFIICEGNSNTHLRSLAGEVEYQLSLCGISPDHIEGYEDGNWILIDLGTVVVHLLSQESRNYYHLEKLWSEAESIDVAPILAQFAQSEEEAK
jgi:ribosome-associated protein